MSYCAEDNLQGSWLATLYLITEGEGGDMLTLIFWRWRSSFVSFWSETTNSEKLLPPYCHPLVSAFKWSVSSFSISALMWSIIRFESPGIDWSRILEEVAPSGWLELMAIYYESRVRMWRGRDLQECPKDETISPCDSIPPELEDDPTNTTRDMISRVVLAGCIQDVKVRSFVSQQPVLVDADGG